jgi:hypothetical protein
VEKIPGLAGRVRIGAPDASLTPASGVVAVAGLVGRLGVIAALDDAVGSINQRDRGLTPRPRRRLDRPVRRPRILPQQRLQLRDPPGQHLDPCIPLCQHLLQPGKPLQQLHSGRRIGHAGKHAPNHQPRSSTADRKQLSSYVSAVFMTPTFATRRSGLS